MTLDEPGSGRQMGGNCHDSRRHVLMMMTGNLLLSRVDLMPMPRHTNLYYSIFPPSCFFGPSIDSPAKAYNPLVFMTLAQDTMFELLVPRLLLVRRWTSYDTMDD